MKCSDWQQWWNCYYGENYENETKIYMAKFYIIWRIKFRLLQNIKIKGKPRKV